MWISGNYKQTSLKFIIICQHFYLSLSYLNTLEIHALKMKSEKSILKTMKTVMKKWLSGSEWSIVEPRISSEIKHQRQK